jgi:hypothetical protein
VASCSLEAFLFCYSILKSLEFFFKKQQKEKWKQKKEAKKARDNIEGALCVFSFLLCHGSL